MKKQLALHRAVQDRPSRPILKIFVWGWRPDMFYYWGANFFRQKRRKIMKFSWSKNRSCISIIIVLFIIIAIYFTQKKQHDYSGYTDVKNPKLYSNMLVICTNSDEFNAFLTKVRSYRYRETQRETYFEYKSYDGSKRAIVVKKRNIDDIPKLQYGIIQLKGYTSDMEQLINLVKDCQKFVRPMKTILLLGGCETYQFETVARKLGVIPVMTHYVGESAHNDYLALQLHSLLSRMSVGEALRSIFNKAPATLNQYILPDIVK